MILVKEQRGRRGLQAGHAAWRPRRALSGEYLHGGGSPSSLESPEASRPTDSRQMIQDCPNPCQSLVKSITES